MNTSIAKVIKGNVSAVQGHLRAVERAREIYLAGIKRLEAEYFERIKNATELVVEPEPEPAAEQSPEAPQQQQAI